MPYTDVLLNIFREGKPIEVQVTTRPMNEPAIAIEDSDDRDA